MAHTTSQLRTKLSAEAQNNEGQPWSTVEAAVELLLAGQVTGSTGGATAANQTTEIATLGAPTGTAVTTDVNGTIQQYLRGLVKLAITAGGHLVTISAGSAAIGSTTDGGAAWTTVFGVAGARFTSADQSAAVASVTDAPTSGQKLIITDIEISVDTAMRVDLSEETTGTIVSSVYMAANSTVNLITRSKRKLITANKKLQVRTSAAGNISVGAFYYSEA